MSSGTDEVVPPVRRWAEHRVIFAEKLQRRCDMFGRQIKAICANGDNGPAAGVAPLEPVGQSIPEIPGRLFPPIIDKAIPFRKSVCRGPVEIANNAHYSPDRLDISQDLADPLSVKSGGDFGSEFVRKARLHLSRLGVLHKHEQ